MIDFLETNIGHIFGSRPGHVPDTPANRSRLKALVNDGTNLLGSDSYGQDCYAALDDDGRQW